MSLLHIWPYFTAPLQTPATRVAAATLLSPVPHLAHESARRFDSHADDFEYVMYGKVFRHHQKAGDPDMSVFVSFGGLLMHLRGDEAHLKSLDLDNRVYLLIRKN